MKGLRCRGEQTQGTPGAKKAFGAESRLFGPTGKVFSAL